MTVPARRPTKTIEEAAREAAPYLAVIVRKHRERLAAAADGDTPKDAA